MTEPRHGPLGPPAATHEKHDAISWPCEPADSGFAPKIESDRWTH
jgi:hypothetical protein